MVRGLERFRERFAGREGSFVVIGGSACHEWFAQQALAFRATKDIDLVLIVEALDDAFVAAFRSFIHDGDYRTRERFDGTPELHRFASPSQPDFPYMVELFSRRPERLELRVGQTVVPIGAPEAAFSLSAILLDDDYYQALRSNAELVHGLPVAATSLLIPLKARAWLDLTERRARGEAVDERDIVKHRNDVFRLAAIVSGDGAKLPLTVRNDVRQFLETFPDDDARWSSILTALSATFGRQAFGPAALRSALADHYGLGSPTRTR